jgi:hypothetical protein
LVYDVWFMSSTLNYPIPNQGLNYVNPNGCFPNAATCYPDRSGVDWTIINPQPKQKTFFEFAQTFWKNTINVRNRQFSTDGKTSGYPTLQSIYWKYLQSLQDVNIPNNNFTYKTMIDYVNGLGDYWIRLIEQMVPATTIWNTGVKMENSIFHRQKFQWKRQRGCQIITQPTPETGGDTAPDATITALRPPLCRPCELIDNIYTYDCPVQNTECPKYPWESDPKLSNFGSVLGKLLNEYLTSVGYDPNNCSLNNLTTQWYVDIRIDDVQVVSYPFFNGIGYNFIPLSYPTTSDWDTAIVSALNLLKPLGYDYYFTTNDTIVVYNQICTIPETDINFKLNVGINFSIYCI